MLGDLFAPDDIHETEPARIIVDDIASGREPEDHVVMRRILRPLMVELPRGERRRFLFHSE